MLCKKSKKNDKIMTIVVTILGILSLVFGIYFSKTLDDSQHNLQMLAGMFSGAGSALLVLVIIGLIMDKVTSPEKKRQKEIEENDERNQQLMQKSLSLTASASVIIMAVMSSIFVWMGYKEAAFITIGAIYLETVIFFIIYKIQSKKM